MAALFLRFKYDNQHDMDIDHNLVREFEARFGKRLTKFVLGFFMAGVVAGALALIFAVLKMIAEFAYDAINWLNGAGPIPDSEILAVIIALCLGLFLTLVGYLATHYGLAKLNKRTDDVYAKAKEALSQSEEVLARALDTQRETKDLFAKMRDQNDRFEETRKDMERLEEATKDLDLLDPSWRPSSREP